jgi:hypothetical protein
MILTEETQWSFTTASMETANGRMATEKSMFGNEVEASQVDINTIPGQTTGNGWTANTSAFVSKLSSTQKIGPNQLLKVMGGDLLSANVQYYYKNSVVNQSGSTVFNSVLTMLGSTIVGSNATSVVTKNAASAITGNLNAGTAFSQLIAPDITSPNGQLAKAYLNVVFFLAEGPESEAIRETLYICTGRQHKRAGGQRGHCGHTQTKNPHPNRLPLHWERAGGEVSSFKY